MLWASIPKAPCLLERQEVYRCFMVECVRMMLNHEIVGEIFLILKHLHLHSFQLLLTLVQYLFMISMTCLVEIRV